MEIKCLKNGAIAYENDPGRPHVFLHEGEVINVDEKIANVAIRVGYAEMVKKKEKMVKKEHLNKQMPQKHLNKKLDSE